MGDRRALTLGIALVAVGFYALASRSLGWRGPEAVLLLLGAIFFFLSALSRFRGPLLPAGVLLGLGVGMLLREPLEPWMSSWAAILLGLGGGFLLVSAIDRSVGRKREPPPIVPGVALTGIAVAEAATRALPMHDLLARLDLLWPFLVFAAGLLLVATALRRRRT
jgi:hypothetical protein